MVSGNNIRKIRMAKITDEMIRNGSVRMGSDDWKTYVADAIATEPARRTQTQREQIKIAMGKITQRDETEETSEKPSRYRVSVGRRLYEYVIVEVDARSNDEAEAKTLQIAQEEASDLDWHHPEQDLFIQDVEHRPDFIQKTNG